MKFSIHFLVFIENKTRSSIPIVSNVVISLDIGMFFLISPRKPIMCGNHYFCLIALNSLGQPRVFHMMIPIPPLRLKVSITYKYVSMLQKSTCELGHAESRVWGGVW